MQVHFSSLNSGSNGNCYYVGNDEDAVLIDVGLSCREIERRMLRCGLDPLKVRAVFISHEHSDHIRGLEVFARKYRLPVYISEGTWRNCRFSLDGEQVRYLTHGSSIFIGELEIECFKKYHDAADPVSFVVRHREIHIGVFTDLGRVCAELSRQFSRCHAAFLESNYDREMLDKSSYPFFLKQRISGGHGHLSNDHALQLFREQKPPFMSHLLLSHLSRQNNCPQLVERLFKACSGDVQVIIAGRDNETSVYSIPSTWGQPNRAMVIPPAQMSLF